MRAYTYTECFIKHDYPPFNLNNAFIKIEMFGVFKYRYLQKYFILNY